MIDIKKHKVFLNYARVHGKTSALKLLNTVGKKVKKEKEETNKYTEALAK